MYLFRIARGRSVECHHAGYDTREGCDGGDGRQVVAQHETDTRDTDALAVIKVRESGRCESGGRQADSPLDRGERSARQSDCLAANG